MNVNEWLNDLCVSEISFVNTYDAENKSYPMKNPGRTHSGFLYTLEGAETYHFDNKSITASPDTILFIPRGTDYGITLDGKRSIVITVDFEFLGDFSEPFLVKFEKNNTVKAHFRELEKTWNKKSADSTASCKAVFYEIVASIIKQKNLYMSSDKHSKIFDAVNYLHENYLKNDFKIETLAEISGISSRYFEKLFKQKFGVSPKEYVLHLRIERAKEMLLSEKNLVSDVALLLGYSDIYHFSKIFKSKTNMTPTEYRKQFYNANKK